MKDKIDKSLILSRIKFHYKFKSDAQLARFLGLGTNTLANWYTRNTINYDLIFTKCDELNPNWIITGEGRPTKAYTNTEENGASTVTEQEVKNQTEYNQLTEIERLHQIITLQEGTIAAQAKTIEVMNKLINAKDK
ncbi:helix-turn-helix domain-containing protein [Pedobacter boryungensis]|uniref:Helix-turn-helix domain-containing protein n=1 Tax=Pedobacter boryungensis TaxID=869962 RepID=A0ABX2DFF6_9SPHI|nr:helix-turn-helix domain-containing protein [Pedobacter boryungensis]NQX31879.1 helix-turn-helix domain-containing protein [Pedobacter boryungensis]